MRGSGRQACGVPHGLFCARHGLNNPVKYLDPDGHEPCSSGNGLDCLPAPPDNTCDVIPSCNVDNWLENPPSPADAQGLLLSLNNYEIKDPRVRAALGRYLEAVAVYPEIVSGAEALYEESQTLIEITNELNNQVDEILYTKMYNGTDPAAARQFVKKELTDSGAHPALASALAGATYFAVDGYQGLMRVGLAASNIGATAIEQTYIHFAYEKKSADIKQQSEREINWAAQELKRVVRFYQLNSN